MANPHKQHNHEIPISTIPGPVVVVMLPFAAQRHVTQVLQMVDVISSYGMPVHFASSGLLNSQVKSRASNSLQHLTKIHFHDLPIPTNRNLDAKTDVSKNLINFEITMGLHCWK
ncbi:UDP-glucuronosyl/UDP-glucosyltransferase [Trema orientale]|uniref:UDP-glucuronosyl/UDP-glucosyltransferase n=1 Tax=Trema orientale TaxID=63057 RepID=A0A2P5EXU5_TREOI|nr:UDP-glucuronosyl/UDP-glucosyltransferase [Trema orientale]